MARERPEEKAQQLVIPDIQPDTKLTDLTVAQLLYLLHLPMFMQLNPLTFADVAPEEATPTEGLDLSTLQSLLGGEGT